MNIAQKCLGTRLFTLAARPTYNQFVAGDNAKSLKATVEDLNRANIRLMACTGLEEDVGESISGKEWVAFDI